MYIPLVAWWWWRHGQRRYFSGTWKTQTRISGAGCLCFFGASTHILLDCFTTYGTPNLRPFLQHARRLGDHICRRPHLHRTVSHLPARCSSVRTFRSSSGAWNWAGLALSSTYLAVTAFNYTRVSNTFEEALNDQGVAYERFFITPTIFNNVLWNGVVDAGDVYLLAQYSFYDEVPYRSNPWTKASNCFTTWTPTLRWLLSLVQCRLLERGEASRWWPASERFAVWHAPGKPPMPTITFSGSTWKTWA